MTVSCKECGIGNKALTEPEDADSVISYTSSTEGGATFTASGNGPVTIAAPPTGEGIALETQGSGAQFEDDMDEEEDVELTVDDLENLG